MIRSFPQLNYFKLIFAFLISLYFVYYAYTLTEWHFIDNLNLLVHEAGHTIFMPFGETIYFLGGSLLQILLPLIFVINFLFKQQKYSAAITLFWVGQNILNVSVYVGDAVNMKLHLIGGEGVIHDWNQLLFSLGWLRHTVLLGNIFYYSGLTVVALAAILSIYFSFDRDAIIKNVD